MGTKEGLTRRHENKRIVERRFIDVNVLQNRVQRNPLENYEGIQCNEPSKLHQKFPKNQII
jgi:hypothetical protein